MPLFLISFRENIRIELANDKNWQWMGIVCFVIEFLCCFMIFDDL